jgi:hypothetical protein
MRFASSLAALSLSFATAACPAMPTPIATVQQEAQDLSVDARFGRMELAMEKVAPAERDEFAAHHRAWGSQIRIADVELAGTRKKSLDEIRVLLHVSWYRPEENELRQTTIEQIWRNGSGWQLAQERRSDGDAGLLGEPDDRAPRVDAGPPAHFPTVRLRGTSPE